MSENLPSNPTLPFLPRLFHRFTKLTSLDLSHFHGDLNNLLIQISTFSFNQLTHLSISPTNPPFPKSACELFPPPSPPL
ncbi:F-box/LRR-repeat protein [Trifolium pratense]|uniref:F-box/LRR-repeat protein n=1 Tax=Trifolium pratense TaxID=57577 RepID=A0A2K3P745_TRIPR|nr:F-box/LRR-repeat protein [Trifolium pratense]